MLIEQLIRKRWVFFGATLIILLLAATQLARVVFNGDLNVMFDPDDKHYQRLQALNEEYSESQYLVILAQFPNQSLFSQKGFEALKELAEETLQLPYVLNVNALTNQNLLKIDGDNIDVKQLIESVSELSHDKVATIKKYAVSDELISKQFISKDKKTAILIANVNLPPDRVTALLKLGKTARELQKDFQTRIPGSKLYLNGDVMVEEALLSVTKDDILRVNPIVFLTIFLLLGFFLRSWMAILATGAVVLASTGISSGIHVLVGFEMNPITMMAPAIIMVLAVADSIHVLTVYIVYAREGKSVHEAMKLSLAKNLAPIFWTSLTTAVGFLGMNFGDSPPFRIMGNMAAIGVLVAFICTFTVLPAAISLFPVNSKNRPLSLATNMRRLSYWATNTKGFILLSVLALTLILACFIPQMKVNDDISEYFDSSLPIHDAIAFTNANSHGVQTIYYSMDSGHERGIFDPSFLNRVDRFSNWLKQQAEVEAVFSYVDPIKKINKVMHNDNPEFYRIPNDPELAAQYHVLYEMSLPEGMDLYHEINLDHSAFKLRVHVKNSDNQTVISLEKRIETWLRTNDPGLTSLGTSQLLMFSHMGTNIVHSMVDGSLFTLMFITICMILALRSWKFGLLSIIPNVFPAVLVYGVWALLVGKVNHAAAMTFSICLGLIVDDSIHIISKYLSERRRGTSKEKALEYTFLTSGTAVVITSVTLICGILLLSMSNFTVNDTMSIMLAGIIASALLFDLIFLPALLIWADSKSSKKASGYQSKHVELQERGI